jgi:kynurenine formamidase
MTAFQDGLPDYNQIPGDPAKPPRSSWGLFGADDQMGTINFLTPERTAHAATLVRKGRVFSLNWEMEKPYPPILGRKAMHHTIIDLTPGTDDSEWGTDDFYDGYWPQSSTQWDALSHMPHPEFGYYNGVQREHITGRPGTRNGIENWGRRGIAGRFVLADVARLREFQGRPIDASKRIEVPIQDVQDALDAQGVRLLGGDILLIRMGWIRWYDSVSMETRVAISKLGGPELQAPGLSADESTLEWLWNNRIAAAVCDVPALEAMPYTPTVEGFLHFRIIPLLGMAVGEMFALDALADDCAGDGVWEGLFTAAPLNKLGGSGSPGNALALK